MNCPYAFPTKGNSVNVDMGGSKAEEVLLWERRGKWSPRANSGFRVLRLSVA